MNLSGLLTMLAGRLGGRPRRGFRPRLAQAAVPLAGRWLARINGAGKESHAAGNDQRLAPAAGPLPGLVSTASAPPPLWPSGRRQDGRGRGTRRADGTGRAMPLPEVGLRAMTPRAMVELSLELYLRGMITQAEYRLLAFQPEFHPAYGRTIGALTGRMAQPDRPRDFILHWQERLAFEASHGPVERLRVKRTRAILEVLTRFDRRPGCRPAAAERRTGDVPQPLTAVR